MYTNRVKIKPRRQRFIYRYLEIGAVVLLTGCGQSTQSNPLSQVIEPFMSPSPGQTARDAFNLYDADLRRQSITSLSAADFGGEEVYVRMYRLLMDDPDPTVRAACVKALGIHGHTQDAQLIAIQLEDVDPMVRWEAAKSLQHIHHESAVGPLIKILRDDEDVDVKMATAYALGQYAQPRVFHALVGTLNDQSFGVVYEGCRALCTLTGQDLGEDANDWMAWAKAHHDNLFEYQKPYAKGPSEPNRQAPELDQAQEPKP